MTVIAGHRFGDPNEPSEPSPPVGTALSREALRSESPRKFSTLKPRRGKAPKPDDFYGDGQDGSARQEPLDPAVIVAQQMLARGMEALPAGSIAVGAPGSIAVVHTPDAEWTEAASEAWETLVREGTPAHGEDGHWRRDSTWIAFVRTGEGTPRSKPDPDDRLLPKAMMEGRAVVGFSPDPDLLLPRDLVQAADIRIAMPPPTPDDAAAAARSRSGIAPQTRLTEAEAAALTPRLLRLACRPNQDADGYILKLSALLFCEAVDQAQATAAVATPRDEPTLHRLHGMDEAVAWGLDLASDLRDYVAGRLPWSGVGGQACLLSGPPGCGKSLFARALATTCGVPLITGSYGQWHSSGEAHQGHFLKAMRATFAEARKGPSILFVDEVDSFPNRATLRHSHADYMIQVVNALLAEIDGVEGREGVVILAACNHPEMLDPALVRSGRLDRHIRIGLPDRRGLARIFREHLSGDLPGEPLAAVALAAAGSTGADVERIVRGARGRSRKAARPMGLSDLMAEIDGGDRRTEVELRTTAVHEAGHAVAFCVLLPGCLEAVTLQATGNHGGGIVSSRSNANPGRRDLHRYMTCVLAGRAAEEVVLGTPSSGCGGSADSDLAEATLTATRATSCLGLGDHLGLVWSGVPDAARLPDILQGDPGLRDEVRAMLDAAYAEALVLMERRRAALDALAVALLQRRALDSEEVAAIVARHPADVGS